MSRPWLSLTGPARASMSAKLSAASGTTPTFPPWHAVEIRRMSHPVAFESAMRRSGLMLARKFQKRWRGATDLGRHARTASGGVLIVTTSGGAGNGPAPKAGGEVRARDAAHDGPSPSPPVG